MRNSIDELAAQAALRLAELGYVPGTVQHYRTAWNKVKRWCSERGVVSFDSDQERRLIEDLRLDGNFHSSSERSMLRRVRSLLSLNDDGAFRHFLGDSPMEFPISFVSMAIRNCPLAATIPSR